MRSIDRAVEVMTPVLTGEKGLPPKEELPEPLTDDDYREYAETGLGWLRVLHSNEDTPLTGKPCPRCGLNRIDARFEGDKALSRADNETWVCSPCGEAEGMGWMMYASEGVDGAQWIEYDRQRWADREAVDGEIRRRLLKGQRLLGVFDA